MWLDYGRKWNGRVAAESYTGTMAKSLQKAWPRCRSFTVLEDNDPTGFKSNKGIAAKRSAKISAFEIPKRSPDLSVMDYAVWKAIGDKMRKQERKFPRSKRETRAAYIVRLRGAALALPRLFIRKAICNMRRRCQLIFAAKGGHIQDGGRHGA